jgi:hypothetical protein
MVASELPLDLASLKPSMESNGIGTDEICEFSPIVSAIFAELRRLDFSHSA